MSAATGKPPGSLAEPLLGPNPRRAVQRVLGRALFDLALGPLRVGTFWFERPGIVDGIESDLATFPPHPSAPALPELPSRPLRVFVSCGETSGEGHARRLVERLRHHARTAGAPVPEIAGLGGETLREAGVTTIGNPTARATIAGQGVMRDVPYYLDLLEKTAAHLRDVRPDVFAPVDAPALHVPMAKLARGYGVPTVHFVAPQYWGWAPWRVDGYRKVITRALTILPWEPSWFGRHGVATAHVGHPELDALVELPPPAGDEAREGLVLLPGSRKGELELNLPWMVAVARRLRAANPSVTIRLALAREEYAPKVDAILGEARAWIRPESGELHKVVGRSRAALAVSGTVLIDLLHHRLPTVVGYAARGGARARLLQFLLTCPWFASTNLIAREEVLPEFSLRVGRDPGELPDGLDQVGDALLRCYNDEAWRERCRTGLERVARRLGPPGAADRAALHVLEVAAERARKS